ncbi:MAG: VTT domain-containing protein [Limisphaerales bacterium]
MTEVLPLSPGAVAEWLPLWKAAGFFFATFMLEDVATVGAGLLLATGQISWPAAFAACFLGIWLGDAGLYALARFAGRGWFEGSSFRKYSAKVARSEQWFTRRGTMILIFSRMIPGARLPTYLAAGGRRISTTAVAALPARHGVAAFFWTFIVLFLAQTFGNQVIHWLNNYKSAGWLMLGVGVGAFILLQWLRRIFSDFDSRKFATNLARWRVLGILADVVVLSACRDQLSSPCHQISWLHAADRIKPGDFLRRHGG